MAECGKKDLGKMSKQHRDALSKAKKGKKLSSEHAKKISEGMKNSPCKRKKKGS